MTSLTVHSLHPISRARISSTEHVRSGRARSLQWTVPVALVRGTAHTTTRATRCHEVAEIPAAALTAPSRRPARTAVKERARVLRLPGHQCSDLELALPTSPASHRPIPMIWRAVPKAMLSNRNSGASDTKVLRMLPLHPDSMEAHADEPTYSPDPARASWFGTTLIFRASRKILTPFPSRQAHAWSILPDPDCRVAEMSVITRTLQALCSRRCCISPQEAIGDCL